MGAARVAQACDIIEQPARALASQESVGTALAAAVHRLDECYVPSRATVIARYRGAGRVKLQPRSRTSRGSAVTPDGGDAPTQPFAPAIGK